MNFTTLARYAPVALALLRIVTALVFLEHGTQKLFDFPPMHMSGPPPGAGAGGGSGGPGGLMHTLFAIAGPLETIGGLLALVGLFTRPVAFILAGETAVVFWIAHVPHGGIFPILNGGESAVLFCFVFLYLVFAGPGAWSLDGLRVRRGA